MKFSKLAISAGVLAGMTIAHAQQLGGVGSNSGMYTRSPYGTASSHLDSSIDDKSGWSSGDFTVHPRIGFLAIKEDNPYLSNQSPEDETYMVISPGLLLRQGNTQYDYFFVDVSADVPVGFDESDEDLENYGATLGYRYDRSKSALNARYGYTRTRNGDVILGNRVSKAQHSAAAGYDYKLSGKTAVGVHVRYAQNDFENDSLTDFTDLKLSGRVNWKVADKSRLFAQLSGGQVEVDSNIDGFADAEYTEASVGVRSELTSRSSLQGTIGYQTRNFDRDEIEDVEGITSSLAFDSLLFDHVKAGVQFWSIIQPSVNEAGGSVVETRVEPSLSRRVFMDELVAYGSLLFGHVEYSSPDNQEVIGEISSNLVSDGREDDYFGYTLGLDFQATEDLSVGAGYSYLENDSTGRDEEESANYETTRLFLRALYNF